MTEPDLSRLPAALRGKLEAQLARLPPELRGTVQARLARLPPEQLAQLLERGSPMLEKLVARADTLRRTGAVHHAQGHYNQTVKAGDKRSWLLLPLFVVAVIVALLHAAGIFSAA